MTRSPSASGACRRRLPRLKRLTLLVSLPGAALAVDGAPPDAVTLDRIAVTGARTALDAGADGGTRLALSIRETPASVFRIDRDALDARGVRSTQEALFALPGLVVASPPGNGNAVTWRGFSGAQVTQLFNGINVQYASIAARPVPAGWMRGSTISPKPSRVWWFRAPATGPRTRRRGSATCGSITPSRRTGAPAWTCAPSTRARPMPPTPCRPPAMRSGAPTCAGRRRRRCRSSCAAATSATVSTSSTPSAPTWCIWRAALARTRPAPAHVGEAGDNPIHAGARAAVQGVFAMSRSTLLAACLAAIVMTGCQPASEGASAPAASADPATVSSTGAAQGVRVSDAWIRETPPNAAVAGGYLTLRSDADDRLVAVETSASASVEIHEMSHAGGVMRMRELPDGVELPAGTDVSLRPGGNHLMFIGPVEPVRAGQTIEATLRFQNAPEQTVQFEVRPLTGDAPAAEGHSGH
ncbi:hypothetical protein CMZ82_02770 [Lysobacteraceae bacterium NML93-0792]|nr:hypothetical protein CMZ82_02770 [Xanthomonadaceae bacterium NML93-0792]PBS16316.1 hypothetical protein CMZ81_05845 [Xanthomonadaceae bacterium NML93-0793]PBS19126.1 hypothetical protein CMZ80_07990 [Xanthomonadaceae bacterium NML93-0831]